MFRKKGDRISNQLRAHLAVAEALATASTFDEAATAMLKVIGETLDWEVGALWAPDGDELACRAVWEAHPGRAAAFVAQTRSLRLRHGEGLPGRVWAAPVPARIRDVTADANFPRAASASTGKLRGAIAVPVGPAAAPLAVMEFFSGRPLDDDGGVVGLMAALAGHVANLSARLEAERGLRAANALLSATLDAALDAIVTMDADGVVTGLNAAAERTFGYPRELAIGQRLADVFIPAASREAHREGLARYLASGVGPIVGQRVEIVGLRANGQEFPVELAVTAVKAGYAVTFVGHVRDITDRKHREAAADRARAFQEELMGLISHELRSPVAAITANATLLQRLRGQAGDHEPSPPLDDIERIATRLQQVVGNMLALGRAESETMLEPVLVQRIVSGAVARFRQSRPGRTIHLSVDGEIEPASGVETFIDQTVENLLTNADKYSPPEEPIAVRVSMGAASVEVRVSNGGPGLAPGEAQRLFDPFFRAGRTADSAPGVGLGLTVCKRLVEAQGGTIWVESTPGEGATFGFSLRALSLADDA